MPAQTPTVERSSEEETVTEGLLPAVERSSVEETATVVGTRGLELRTPAVERSSGEETVTEGLLPTVERSWVEETATAHGDDGQHWNLTGPGIRGRLLAMDDSGRCYGQRLLNGPRERRP